MNLMTSTFPFIQENQKVKKELLEAQTNIAFLQSELDALKSDYADQSLNTERYELCILFVSLSRILRWSSEQKKKLSYGIMKS